ncbi:MAG TPA: hypothetical protein VGB98_25225 [Pyrinomonadaceae bacterium]
MRATLLLTSLTALCLLAPPAPCVARGARESKGARPLWPGSRFTAADRARAVRRGLDFIYLTARDPSNFEVYGSDYLWCFYTVGESVSDPEVRASARRMGLERARHWRRTHQRLPRDADAHTVIDYAFGADAADSLGLKDPRLKLQIRRAAARFGALDFMLFDPRTEPPPRDAPAECEADRAWNQRGASVCRRCGRALKMRTPQDVWYDALITAYVGERYGVGLGASYAEVLGWLPSLRPHRGPDSPEFYDTVYAVTHVVYTLNDYGQRRVPARLLPEEFAFLKENLRAAVAAEDADMLGEFMDTLRAFGLTDADAEIREGAEYLLAHQNADGSWGDPVEKDIYKRYHPTWNAVAALSNYAWRGDAPEARRLRLLRRLGR